MDPTIEEEIPISADEQKALNIRDLSDPYFIHEMFLNMQVSLCCFEIATLKFP